MRTRSWLAVIPLLFLLLACKLLSPRPDPAPTPTLAGPRLDPAPTPSLASPRPDLAPTPSLAGPPAAALAEPCRAALDRLTALRLAHPLPKRYNSEEQPMRQAGDFDPNQYFQVFTHLHPAPGYVLDYVYNQSGLGGFPMLYARPADSPALESSAEIERPSGEGSLPAYLKQVQVDGTPESYLEYVVLSLVGNQFYLIWHANYNDTRVLCDPGDLEPIKKELAFFDQSFSAEATRQLESLDMNPAVVIAGDVVTVRVLTFTKWGGFYENIYRLDTTHLDHPVEVQQNQLIPYDCGIMF